MMVLLRAITIPRLGAIRVNRMSQTGVAKLWAWQPAGKLADLSGFALLYGVAVFALAQVAPLLSSGATDDAGNAAMAYQTLIHFTLGVMAVATWHKRLTLLSLGITMAAAAVVAFNDMADAIHHLLTGLGLYPDFFRMPSGDVNPQYPKIFALVVLLVWLGALNFRRSTRTMDRVFAMISGTAMAITLTLFHFAGPHSAMRFERSLVLERISLMAQTAPYMPFFPGPVCESAKLSCSSGSEQEIVGQASRYGEDAIHQIEGLITALKENQSWSHATSFYGDFVIGASDRRRAVAVATRDRKLWWLIIDDTAPQRLQFLAERNFAFLATCATFVWSVGLFSLLLAHRSMKFRRSLAPRS